VLTAADAVATAADSVQTGLDRIATAADRVQTGLDAATASAAATALSATSTTTLTPSLAEKVVTTQAGNHSTQELTSCWCPPATQPCGCTGRSQVTPAPR